MRRILIVLCILGAMASLEAQSPIRFSVHVDPQFAWLNSDDNAVIPDGSFMHMQVGLTMDYFFAPNYAFSMGLAINNMGGNLRYSDTIDFYSKGEILEIEAGQKVKLNTQYVDIPIGLKLKSEELGYTTFFLQLGFNPMVLINAKGTSDNGVLDKHDIVESIHRFSLGYHAGLGIEYQLGGNTALIGGLRWQAGLTDITDNDQANVKTNLISVHLGVLF